MKLNKIIEMANRSESIPNYYDTVSLHDGPDPEKIPARFKGRNSDRTMHHMIRYYGQPELGKCNTEKASLPGESSTDWTKPAPFQGEFPGCGEPTGKMWLTKAGALAAAKDAVETYMDDLPKDK